MVKMLRARSRVELEVGCDYGCCRVRQSGRQARHKARQYEKHEMDTIVSEEMNDE